ncbi:atlastin-2-like [Ornithodoros turicata]|uniref:atlastin-2-like n=1 Tax=Ornithodoros turicata TaxID=34597 RepID=UPI003138696C
MEEPVHTTGCPVVVRPASDPNSLELRSDNLACLLTHPDVADLPVVVLSVAGGFRLGKSFLLGFCIRYLEHLEASPDSSDWMEQDNIPLTGFSWRYGSQRETTGIHLWGKVFKVETKRYGTVAVILMDTEGSFDNRTTLEGNVTIFSISMLLSSIQLYNLTKQITQADLEHLKLFTEYASMARNAGGDGNEVFQKLLFLIRDWQFPQEKSFGLEGGEELLQALLETDPTLPDEVCELRKRIRTSFAEVGCFLMPRPGDAVESQGFDGRLSALSEDFRDQLDSLLDYLLSTERLLPKMINGRKITCKELVSMFQVYFNVFSGKQLPEPMTVFNATAYVNNKRIIEEIVKQYETEMEAVARMTADSDSDSDIVTEHDRLMRVCLEKFESAPKLGDFVTTLREKLIEELNSRYDTLKRTRNMLREYSHEMKNRVAEERELCQREYQARMEKMFQEESERRAKEMRDVAEAHNLDLKKLIEEERRRHEDEKAELCREFQLRESQQDPCVIL